MTFDHDASWWTAVAAIGQVLGAIATFLAVALSLWIVRTDRSLKGRGSAKILVTFVGDGSPGQYYVGFIAENTGIRDFLVHSISWRIGWTSWGPNSLKYSFAIQTSGSGHIFENRWVKASLSETFLISVKDMKIGLAPENERGAFFTRKLSVLGWAPIKAYVNIAGGKPIPLSVDETLKRFLRTAAHPNTTADA